MRDIRSSFWANLPLNRNFANALVTGYGLMAITILIQLVLVPLYLSHLGKSKFGVLILILAVNNYAAIGIGWLSGGMARILAERAATHDREGFRAAYAFSKILFTGYSLIAITVFWVAAPWLLADQLKEREIWSAMLLSSVYLLLVYEYNTDRLALCARHWQAQGNVFEVVGQLLFACVVIGGVYAGLGLPGVIAGQIAGIVFTRFLASRYWKNDDYQLGWSWPVSDFVSMWKRVSGKMGRDYVAYSIILLTLQADVLIVGWLSGPEMAATFYLLWRIPEVCILLLARIPGSYSPFLVDMEARGEYAKLAANYAKGLKLMIVLSGVLAIVYAVFGQRIVDLWVNEGAPSGQLAYLLAACALFFTAVSRWPSGVAYSLVRTDSLIKVAGVELLLKLAIFAWMYSEYTYISPLAGTALSHVLGVFFLYLWLGRTSCRAGENVRHV